MYPVPTLIIKTISLCDSQLSQEVTQVQLGHFVPWSGHSGHRVFLWGHGRPETQVTAVRPSRMRRSRLPELLFTPPGLIYPHLSSHSSMGK